MPIYEDKLLSTRMKALEKLLITDTMKANKSKVEAIMSEVPQVDRAGNIIPVSKK